MKSILNLHLHIQALHDLKWETHQIKPFIPPFLDEEVGQNNQGGCRSNDTRGSCTCHHEPLLSACKHGCQKAGPTGCSVYAWSNHSQPEWTFQCCYWTGGDASWHPRAQTDHVSGHWVGGQKGTNIWKTTLSTAAADIMAGSTQLRVALTQDGEVLRAPRARYPNANPETDIFPTGWNSGNDVQWLPPSKPQTKLQIVGPINNR